MSVVSVVAEEVNEEMEEEVKERVLDVDRMFFNTENVVESEAVASGVEWELAPGVVYKLVPVRVV